MSHYRKNMHKSRKHKVEKYSFKRKNSDRGSREWSHKSYSGIKRVKQLTLASAAGFTFPLTKNAPPRIIIFPIFFANPESNCKAYINLMWVNWTEEM